MYSRLKGYPLNQAYRELKPEYAPLAWSTGIRLSESKRRARNYVASQEKGYDKHKSRVWINPIIYWDETTKNDLINAYNLPKNPVYQYLCKSGECLCGAFAQKGELLELEMHYPVVYDRLNNLYEEIKDKFPWKWDEQYPKGMYSKKKKDSNQLSLDNYMPLCHTCNANFERAESSDQ